MRRKTAVYVRVSSNRQEFRSQVSDLRSWTDAFALDGPVLWFEDKVTGTTMDRPGWQRLEREIQAGRITRLVVWRLDRLGRDAAGLVTLLDELQRRGIQFVSIKDGIDLDTPAGRLMARVKPVAFGMAVRSKPFSVQKSTVSEIASFRRSTSSFLGLAGRSPSSNPSPSVLPLPVGSP